jgi:REP element-mobilizing transposase RayT
MVEELEFYSRKYGFALMGYAIMPDHLHLLVWWDKEEKPKLSISAIMQGIKGATARRIIDLIRGKGLERMLQSTRRNLNSRAHKQNLKYRIWQPGFYDFDIYSEEKFLEKLDYMHNNPVTAGVVSYPECYEWLSWRLYSLEKVPG